VSLGGGCLDVADSRKGRRHAAVRAHEKDLDCGSSRTGRHQRGDRRHAPVASGLTNWSETRIKFTERGEVMITIGPNPDSYAPAIHVFDPRIPVTASGKDQLPTIVSSLRSGLFDHA